MNRLPILRVPMFILRSLTLTLPMASLWRHLQSSVVSENGLIASKNAIDDAFHLARDEYHKNRTEVKVVKLY